MCQSVLIELLKHSQTLVEEVEVLLLSEDLLAAVSLIKVSIFNNSLTRCRTFEHINQRKLRHFYNRHIVEDRLAVWVDYDDLLSDPRETKSFMVLKAFHQLYFKYEVEHSNTLIVKWSCNLETKTLLIPKEAVSKGIYMLCQKLDL